MDVFIITSKHHVCRHNNHERSYEHDIKITSKRHILMRLSIQDNRTVINYHTFVHVSNKNYTHTCFTHYGHPYMIRNESIFILQT